MSIDISKGKKSIVAFLDVLGFTELIYANNYEKVNDYFNTAIDILSEIDKNENISKHIISDSIILFTDIEFDYFKILLQYIQSIQTQFFLKDIFIRGSISKGEIYLNDNNIIAGKGLIKAFNLEKKALYPRVIIDPILISDFGQTKNDFISKFNEKNDSPSHIDLEKNNYPAKWNFEKKIIFDPGRMDSKCDDCFFISYGHELIANGF